MASARRILTDDDVLPGVARADRTSAGRGLFADGQKLVTVHEPIRPGTSPVEGVVPGRDPVARRARSS